jgi:hypothetical protein
MALPGFSKSPVAAAASLLVALTGFAAVAQTPGFSVTETIITDPTTKPPTTAQTMSLAPNDTTTVTVTVSRSNPEETRPATLTLNFTLPPQVDFGDVTGCTLPDNFDPATDAPTCTIADPFAFDQTLNGGAGGFPTAVQVGLSVSRHFDPKATTCATADLGAVTVEAKTDKDIVSGTALNDDATVSSVTLKVLPYADIDVTATAPTTANLGDTISVVGTVKNLGPCDAPNVRIDPSTADAAGVTLLTFASISGACTVTVKVSSKGAQTPTPGKDGSCVIADLPVGASQTITKTYTVDNVSVNGQTQTMRTSGYQRKNNPLSVADPNADNDVAGTATIVPSNNGCSTGGAVGPMALLGLLLAFWRKRRTA